MSVSKPILFYSKKNHSCISLWNKLKINNQLDQFVKICVDDNNKIPSIVTTVPSIFVKGRPLISGHGIDMYLSSNNQVVQRPVQSMSNNPNQSQNIQKPPTNQDGINSFNPVEMSERWSDSYSFLENNPEPMSYCYQFINGNDKTPQPQQQQQPQNTGMGTRKRGNMLDDRLEKLQQERGMLNNMR